MGFHKPASIFFFFERVSFLKVILIHINFPSNTHVCAGWMALLVDKMAFGDSLQEFKEKATWNIMSWGKSAQLKVVVNSELCPKITLVIKIH